MSFIDNITAQLPFGKKSEQSEYFFALNIGLSQVTAAVWSIAGHDLDILGQATLSYEGSDDLLDKAYKVLDKSLGALELEPQKILFGVPDSWSLDDDLKEPYSKLLKRMLKEYELEPMAFVTTTNAVTFLLQKQEGVPSTAILIGLGDFVESTLVKNGKPIDTKSAKRDGQLFEEIEKTAGSFTEVEVLPSRILLYATKEGGDLSKVRDELMSYPWMQKMPFLHFPKIEILDDDIATRATIAAGAMEIDPHVNLKRNLVIKKQPSPLLHHSGLLNTPEELRPGKNQTKEQPSLEGRHPLKRYHQMVGSPSEEAQDVGFVTGDIRQPREDLQDGNSGEQVQLEDDGLINPNIEQGFDSHPVPRMTEDRVEIFGKSSSKLAFLPAFLHKISGLPLIKNVSQAVRFEGKLGKLIFIPLILAVISAAYLFLVKASVTVFVEPKILEQSAEVVADPQATAVDEEKEIIPASVIETTVSGSGKAAASGQKKIGDSSKGKVVIYNKTDTAKSFSQGTTLSSDNNLKFTLDSSVKVASKSSSIVDGGEVTKWGKSDPTGVTATEIGPDGNLPGGSSLSINGFSDSQVAVKVEEAFSGGTSKNVTVVTADDQKKLQAQVLNEIRSRAEADLQGKVSGDKKIVSEALTVMDGKYNFNKKINDQAGEFSLNATVRFKGTSYSDADLKTMVSKLIKTNVPDGFELNVSSMETQADIFKVEKDGRLIFKAKFKAKLLPIINAEEAKEKMLGKSIKEVADQLKTIDNVIGSEIKFTPKMPESLARLPLLKRNITVNITPK